MHHWANNILNCNKSTVLKLSIQLMMLYIVVRTVKHLSPTHFLRDVLSGHDGTKYSDCMCLVSADLSIRRALLASQSKLWEISVKFWLCQNLNNIHPGISKHATCSASIVFYSLMEATGHVMDYVTPNEIIKILKYTFSWIQMMVNKRTKDSHL